tara:strand:- start:249 stop:686 length:438 start_codon:yes stop_codon:yes gene_type:complete
MIKKINLIFMIFIFLSFFNSAFPEENFFDEAKKKYYEKNIKESKFLFQRNIVFNPKDAKSYLYLAKIYKSEENKEEEKKNLKTTLLLEPNNEEAIYMMINFELERSDYTEVNNLIEKFKLVCTNLCKKISVIEKELKNIESKNES